MIGYIEIAVQGTLGASPIERTTEGGKSYRTFSLAVKDRQTDEVEWVQCAVFGEVADALPLAASKGEKVYVEGRARISRYSGRDGTPQARLNVTAFRVLLLDRIGRRRRRRAGSPNLAQESHQGSGALGAAPTGDGRQEGSGDSATARTAAPPVAGDLGDAKIRSAA